MTNQSLIRKATLFGAWSGVYYCVLLLVGWFVVAGFFPLHRPSADAAEIAEIFRDHAVRIRLGMVLVMWGAAFFIPWTAAVAERIAGIEGREGPLTRITTMGGYANAMLTFYPPLLWIANTFRASERSADLIYLLNDVAWLQFIGGLSLVMPMIAVVALAAFSDRSDDPVFPRWSGFATAWTFLLLLPGQCVFFFKQGPFAWDGLLAFWVPVPVFCLWFLMISWLIRRKCLREALLAKEPA